jgi:hypothetical protein
MCKKFIYLTFFFAFCPMAVASDIAISTQAGWMGQGTADTEAQEIVNNVKGVSVEVFTSTQHAALADWVRDHTGDGSSDLLVMFGNFPATIYPAGNAQADGSLAELFLDDGNTIINTGDYIFYVGSAGNNDAGGLQNMMDVPGATMWGDDSGNTSFAPTADGQLYTPSLTTLPSNRPWLPAQFQGTDWEVELILAQSSDGSQVHPAIMHNTVTGGRLGVFFQWSDDSQPRGEVISEWINNWWLQYVHEANPYARDPNPADGAIGVVSALLQWKAGDGAAYHEVYFGTNPTPGPDEFKGQQNVTTTIYYHADGLVPGTTYYWRIDEVEADETTIHTGKVWSFSVPVLSASNPSPADGAKWIQTDVTLSWSAGWGSIMYQVYLSADLDAVTNGTTEADRGQLGSTSLDIQGLDLETTYYWRVDAFDDKGVWHTGDIWSFTTVGPYAGVKGQYYHHPGTTPPSPPQSAFQTLVLTRVDPGINFSWGEGSPDAAVNVDDFSARWVADLEVAVSDTYTLWTYTDDGVMVWLDGELIIDNWTDHGNTWNSSPALDLAREETHSIEMWWYERGGGAVAQLHWSTATMSRQPIPPGALSLPLRARSPSPANGAVDVKQTTALRWTSGESAAKHDVYFGTDPNAVVDATTASVGIYRGQQNLDATSYMPTESPLAWGTTYYWRIDEVNGVDLWKGIVWSFTTSNCLIVDDFEEYDDFCNRIFYKWKDGWGYSADPDCGVTASAGNGTGSTVGNLSFPYAEQTIVHSGAQSMPYEYNNTGTGGKARYSEASFEFAAAQNWTTHDMKGLSLWFHGETDNDPETLYLALEDSAAQVRVASHPDPTALQVAGWQAWYIDLQRFSGVNLASIKKVYLGVGNRNNPQMGGSGKLYIDDIRVCPPQCVPSMAKPDADIAEPYDCKVDYKDVRVLAYEWLFERQFQDWQERVAYWDAVYPTSWAEAEVTGAVRDALAAAGYTILDADQLKTWMDARIADKKLSVVVFCQDVVPDTVAETMDATCTIRKYLDAGGKVVWYSDIPFYYQGHADGTSTTWDTGGSTAILGFNAAGAGWDSGDAVTITTAGANWGLTQRWDSLRPTAAGDVDSVLATDADGDAAAWVKYYVPRDAARGFVRIADFNVGPGDADLLPDLISVAASKGALAANLYQDDVIDFKDFAVLADSWLEETLWP